MERFKLVQLLISWGYYKEAMSLSPSITKTNPLEIISLDYIADVFNNEDIVAAVREEMDDY